MTETAVSGFPSLLSLAGRNEFFGWRPHSNPANTLGYAPTPPGISCSKVVTVKLVAVC